MNTNPITPITRRTFLKTSAFATGSYLVLTRGTALANPRSGYGVPTPVRWCLVCKQEPAEGDWGNSVADVVGAHGTNTAVSLLLGGNRYFACAAAVTNHNSPTWLSRCIRAGSPGRGDGYTWTKVCAAATYVTLVPDPLNHIVPVAIKLFKPRHSVFLRVNENTGSIEVSDSGNGHTESSTAGGSLVTTKSKINVEGNGTKQVTLDIEWLFEWEGFTSAQINLVKTWVHFGASVNNKIVWSHSGRWIFESVTSTDHGRKMDEYAKTRINRVHSWRDHNDQLHLETPPFAYMSLPNGITSTLVCVEKITRQITKICNSSELSNWEF